jgi:alpha-N-arabinofuranosidase
MQTFQNPILPGFYPDPSVCRVGDDYFLVTSTFAYFPGVPVFKSKDLVHWKQISNVLTRDKQLPLNGVEVSQGIFAPTIRESDGVYYMVTTNVSGGGNFIVTAKNPEGPWSDPHFLKGADGIDPSLFFENGKCYYHGTCNKKDAAYYGDNEIYLQELDLKKMRLVGERFVIWHSALKNAVWPEGPHIYKRGEWYYLLISEGGTAHEHAITVARSRTLTGYYEGNKCNPILTHRHLGKNYPVANVGHGDLIETQNGEWFMVLLASRPYGGYFRNLGRETFLVPVSWENDWPVVNYGVGLVRETERYPNLPYTPFIQPTCFNFRETTEIPINLMHLRNPVAKDYFFENGLNMRLNKNEISHQADVSYLCIRQQHMNFAAQTRMKFSPEKNECAGLVILQNSKFNFQFTLRAKENKKILRVTKCENGKTKILSETETDAAELFLQITARGQELSFLFSEHGYNFVPVFENADARTLNPDTAGGFVGNTIGMYASSCGTPSKNIALFEEFGYVGM